MTALITVNGLSASSYLYFISKQWLNGLVLVPPSFSAESASETLSFFLEQKSTALSFPHFERGYEPVREDPRIIYRRLQTQMLLATKPNENFFLITNLIALSQKVIPQKALQDARLKLERGGWLTITMKAICWVFRMMIVFPCFHERNGSY